MRLFVSHRLLVGEAIPHAIAGQQKETIVTLQFRDCDIRLGGYHLHKKVNWKAMLSIYKWNYDQISFIEDEREQPDRA